jgi:hypothetical protein
VSIPIGSEETYSFKFMRKNQFEEALFKCEDDRFEIDLIIDTNASAIRMLEPIADEIATLRKLVDNERAAPRFSFQLDKRQLGTVHLNAITRLYGDHAAEILELLRKNPAGTIPVVLKRLKQKDLEWRKARQVMPPSPLFISTLSPSDALVGSPGRTHVVSSIIHASGAEQAVEGGGGAQLREEFRPPVLLLPPAGQARLHRQGAP